MPIFYKGYIILITNFRSKNHGAKRQVGMSKYGELCVTKDVDKNNRPKKILKTVSYREGIQANRNKAVDVLKLYIDSITNDDDYTNDSGGSQETPGSPDPADAAGR